MVSLYYRQQITDAQKSEQFFSMFLKTKKSFYKIPSFYKISSFLQTGKRDAYFGHKILEKFFWKKK